MNEMKMEERDGNTRGEEDDSVSCIPRVYEIDALRVGVMCTNNYANLSLRSNISAEEGNETCSSLIF